MKFRKFGAESICFMCRSSSIEKIELWYSSLVSSLNQAANYTIPKLEARTLSIGGRKKQTS